MCGTISRPCLSPPYFPSLLSSRASVTQSVVVFISLDRVLRKVLSWCLEKKKKKRIKLLEESQIPFFLCCYPSIRIGWCSDGLDYSQSRNQAEGSPLGTHPPCPFAPVSHPFFSSVSPCSPFRPPFPHHPSLSVHLKINSTSFCAETLPALGLVLVLISPFLSFPEQVFYPVRREILQHLISP